MNCAPAWLREVCSMGLGNMKWGVKKLPKKRHAVPPPPCLCHRIRALELIQEHQARHIQIIENKQDEMEAAIMKKIMHKVWNVIRMFSTSFENLQQQFWCPNSI